MPYIPFKRRLEIVENGWRTADNPGELNFIFSTIARFYIERNGKSYQKFNDILGALEGAKQEIYRRMIQPYEEKKIKENGDIF